jgi:ParB family chromosome partitioning protein
MQVDVSSIVIQKRVRQELGDLGPLMESLRKHGQLNPIILTSDYELIAGHRRLESARKLGWKTINAVLLDSLSDRDILEMELEENVHRKDLSPLELLDGYKRLDKLDHPGLWGRIGRFFRNVFRRLFRRRRRRLAAPLPAAALTEGAAAPASRPADPAPTAPDTEAGDEFKPGEYAV